MLSLVRNAAQQKSENGLNHERPSAAFGRNQMFRRFAADNGRRSPAV
jgi:hypothetical protein